LDELKSLSVTDSFTYSAQYQQSPIPLGGGIFKETWFNYYRPGSIVFEYMFMTADCANKTKTVNDYSVFCLWGVCKGNLYLIDMIRNKWEAPQLVVNAHSFWCKHFNAHATTARLRFMAVEDKANGTALIQYLKTSTNPVIPIRAIQRNTDKVTRAMDTAPYVASGHVFLPEGASFTLDFVAEVTQFTAALTHRHDDITDNLMDAVDTVFIPSKKTGKAF
jgi:predicted phage terminase large subunit-like protein